MLDADKVEPWLCLLFSLTSIISARAYCKLMAAEERLSEARANLAGVALPATSSQGLSV